MPVHELKLRRRIARWWHGPALLATGVLALAPTAALGGETVKAGNQSLSLTGALVPDHAAGAGSTIKLHIDYESLVPGQRIQSPTRAVIVGLPKGLRFNVKNATQCPVAMLKNSGDASACPSSSIVGTGTVTADARPLLAAPVTGTVTIYNVKGQHNDLDLSIKTAYGTFGYVFFILQNGESADHPILDVRFSNNGGKSLFTLKTVDLSIHNSTSGKPFVSAPKTCTGHQHFGLVIASFGDQDIYAVDQPACRAR